MKFRQVLLRAVLAAAAGTLVFAGPTLGVREAKPGSHGSLRDFVRSGAISKPTAAQRAAVRALHAKATWNNYGTPATLMRPGGFLTKQATGATAVIAARGWLAKHRALFRLSSVRWSSAHGRLEALVERLACGQLPAGLRRPEGRRRRRGSDRGAFAGEGEPLEDRLRLVVNHWQHETEGRGQAVRGASLDTRCEQRRPQERTAREREGDEGRARVDQSPRRRSPRHPAPEAGSRSESDARRCRRTSRSCSIPRPRRRPRTGSSSTPRTGAVLARTSMVDHFGDNECRTGGSGDEHLRRKRAGGRRRLRRQEGAVRGRRRSPGARRLRCGDDPDERPGPQPLLRGRRGSSRRTRCSRRSSSTTSPWAACLQATTSSRSATSTTATGRRQAWDCPDHVHRPSDARRLAGAGAVPGALEGLPGQPAAGGTRRVPLDPRGH